MKFLSVSSGIEAASQAWEPLGWEAVGFSEIKPFPCAYLAHRYPQVLNFGDMTRFHEWPSLRYDLLVGGTPCQAFSVAGLRRGLADPRGNLTLTFLAIAQRDRPRWLVWENVPGVLSSTSHDAPDPCPPDDPVDLEREGQTMETGDHYDSEELHAFQQFVAGLSELGYGWAYRILDAKNFGVPQRRRRVILVGYLGNYSAAAAVLFERYCLLGDSSPGMEAGQGIAGTLTSRSGNSSRQCGGEGNIVPTLDASYGRLQGCSGQDLQHGHGHLVTPDLAHTLRAAHDASEDGTGRGTPLLAGTVTAKWRKGSGGPSGGPSGDECANLVVCQDNAPALTGNPYGDNESREGLLVAFNLRGRDGGAMPEEDPDGLASLRASSGGSSRSYIGFGCLQGGDTQHGYTEDGTPPLRGLQGRVAIAFDPTQITSPDNRSNPQPGDPCHPLSASAHPPAIAFTIHGTDKTQSVASETDTASCLRTKPPGSIENSSHTVALSGEESYVRRLTCLECERLQGFPDHSTLVPGFTYSRDPEDLAESVAYFLAHGFSAEEAAVYATHPDGPRYEALGNSMAVPVMRWIGERIAHVEALINRAA